MSSALARSPVRPARRRAAGARSLPGASPAPRALFLLSFAIAATLAELRFASLLSNPSFPRGAGIVGLSAALGALLMAIGRREPPRILACTASLAATALALLAALCCAGIAARELAPWHWGLLAQHFDRGIEALDGLWPYAGRSPQAREAIMACIAAGLVPAAALAFWPARGGGARGRLGALSLLAVLYVTGDLNGPRAGWKVQGLGLLLALGLWGWASRSRRAEDGRAAAWLLAGAVVSVLAAGALAGGPVIDVASWGFLGEPGADTAFNWDQTYRPLPWSTSPAEMAEVSSRGPHLWRATELDRFDGTGFIASGNPPAEPRRLAAGPQSDRWITRTSVVVRRLDSSLLLSPGEILSVTAAGAELPRLQAPAADGTQAFAEAPAARTGYSTAAYAPRPSVSEMRAAPVAVPPAFRPYVEFLVPGPGGEVRVISGSSPLEAEALAGSPYAAVYGLARRLAAGAPDGYEVAARTEAFLRRNYIYSLSPPASRYPIVTFLLKDRTGYCQQFSAAMALMLRMDGIPARIGAGFTAGTRNPSTGRFDVTGLDAHAWVEVFYEGIGWVPWDPTPEGRRVASEGSFGGAPNLAAAVATKGHRGTAKARPVVNRAAARSAPVHQGGAISWTIPLAITLAVLALGAGLARGRSRRRRRAPVAGSELDELTRALRLLGLEPVTGMTLAELEQRLARSHGEEVGGYLRALREVRYAPGGGRLPTARQRRLLRRALSTGRGPVARLLGLVALPPGGG